jgi:hypothetical protein
MGTWDIDGAVSLPLILLIVVIHVLGLGMINDRIAARAGTGVYRPQLTMHAIAPQSLCRTRRTTSQAPGKVD